MVSVELSFVSSSIAEFIFMMSYYIQTRVSEPMATILSFICQSTDYRRVVLSRVLRIQSDFPLS